ncbi:hypothetical protein I6E44_09055 [Pseudoflavonifractor phocaeensis]|nr:hypothetical protein [Pseudoflavonifractor phocaeensis]MCF2676652.1 hypothetical protein [Pseudoflavonifractor phocaeensis]
MYKAYSFNNILSISLPIFQREKPPFVVVNIYVKNGSDEIRHSHGKLYLQAQRRSGASHKVLLPAFLSKKTGGSNGTRHSHWQSYLRAQKGNEVSHKVLCQAGQKYFARLQILQSVSVCKICVDCT